MKQEDENIENLFGNPRKSEPFKVPESYFETFAERLNARIKEEQPRKKTLFFYLKPIMTIAASVALVMLLIYVPIRKYFLGSNSYLSELKSNNDSVDSTGVLSANIISYFSEEQFMSAVSDMTEMEADTISTDKLADFIAANYNDFEILASN
jgi:hypothetical protein